MADVDMPDAGPSAPAKTKAPTKGSKAGGEGGADGKKRFEVKKVHICWAFFWTAELKITIVECCSLMGLGHCGRQLCYLQKPHYGSMLVIGQQLLVFMANDVQVLNVKPTKPLLRATSAQWHGVSAM